MTFSPSGELTRTAGNPILLGGNKTSNYVPGDSALTSLAAQLYVPVAALATQVVGYTNSVLFHNRSSIGTDTPMANLICVSADAPPLPVCTTPRCSTRARPPRSRVASAGVRELHCVCERRVHCLALDCPPQDAMLWEIKTNYPSIAAKLGPVKICLNNNGGIRASIGVGNITQSNVSGVAFWVSVTWP